MSPRRLIPVIGFGALAVGIVCACLPWSVAAPDIANFVGRELSRNYGVAMLAEGPTEVALLPLPRIAFRGVRLSAGSIDGPVLAEGGSLSLQLNLLALMSGRVDVHAMALEGGTIVLATEADDDRWAVPLGRMAEGLSASGDSHPRRISVNRAAIIGRDPRDGAVQSAQDVDLTLSWPLWSSAIDLAGGFTWKGNAARFAVAGLRPGDILTGEESPFAATAAWPAGSLAVTGNGSLKDGLRLTGRGTVETRSLADTLAWTGSGVALSPFVEALALDGSFEARGQTLHVPSLRVSVGSNRLEGAGSVNFGGTRPAIQATLASETLNVAPVVAGLMRLFGLDDPADGTAWARQGLALHPLTQGDLDLRLSAGSARLGPVLLEDVAASVLVREGSIEASLGRAKVQGATLKGRIGLNASASDREATEIKAQGTFDRLDLGALLIDLGQYRWVLGGAQGQFALEGQGRTTGDLARHVNGRASLSIDEGAIAGLDLAEVMQRSGGVTRSLARRGGRTDFERAGVTLRFADGIGEIVEGSLKASTLSASLSGTVSLPARRFEAWAALAGNGLGGRPDALFELAGPWDAVTARKADPGANSRGGLAGPHPLRAPVTNGLPAGPARAYAP